MGVVMPDLNISIPVQAIIAPLSMQYLDTRAAVAVSSLATSRGWWEMKVKGAGADLSSIAHTRPPRCSTICFIIS
jgi:hypothetical protein